MSFTCRACGEEKDGHGGRSLCEPCRVQACVFCGEEYRVNRPYEVETRKYCSPRCQHDHRIAETMARGPRCRGCGEPFHWVKGKNGRVGARWQFWCSRECRSLHTKRKAAFRLHVRREGSLNRPPAPRVRKCPRCAREFVAIGQRRMYCTVRCSWREQRSRRRARMREAFVEDVSLAYIFQRDRGICGICGERVDRRCKYPHPRTPVLDHITPLSRGGKHEAKNLQLAHHGCNDRKGAGSAGSQLLLVG